MKTVVTPFERNTEISVDLKFCDFLPWGEIAQRQQMEKHGEESEREAEARQYLKKHKIKELFDNLACLLIYNQPGKLN